MSSGAVKSKALLLRVTRAFFLPQGVWREQRQVFRASAAPPVSSRSLAAAPELACAVLQPAVALEPARGALPPWAVPVRAAPLCGVALAPVCAVLQPPELLARLPAAGPLVAARRRLGSHPPWA